jgi:hypothetical protein
MGKIVLDIRHGRWETRLAAFLLVTYCAFSIMVLSGFRGTFEKKFFTTLVRSMNMIESVERVAIDQDNHEDPVEIPGREYFHDTIPPVEYGLPQSHHHLWENFILRLPSAICFSLIFAGTFRKLFRILISSRTFLQEFLKKIQSVRLNR